MKRFGSNLKPETRCGLLGGGVIVVYMWLALLIFILFTNVYLIVFLLTIEFVVFAFLFIRLRQYCHRLKEAEKGGWK